MKIKSLLILSMLILAARPAYAQEHPNQTNAFDAKKLYEFKEIDNINAFNGSLNLTIPLGHEYPINGDLKFSLALIYSSSVWKVEGDVTGTLKAMPGGPDDNIPFNAGLGWHISLGQLVLTSLAPNQMTETNYITADGTKHAFTKPHLGALEDPGDGGSTQRVVYTGDGSFLRLRTLSGPRYAVDFPDGLSHVFNSQGLLEKIEGPFNNPSLKNQEISVSYSADGNTWTITDSHGRLYRLLFRNTFLPTTSLARVLDTVQLSRFGDPSNSDPAEYKLFYTNTTMTLPSPHLPRGETVTVPLLTSVVLPSQASYSMPVGDYITSLPPEDDGRQGLITGITLPTRGRTEWTYRRYVFPTLSSKDHERTSSQGVATRRLVGADNGLLGSWTYETSLRTEPNSQPKELVNTVTVDTGEARFKTVNYFSVYPFNSVTPNNWSVHEYGLPFTRYQTDSTGARFLSTQVYDSNGVLQRSSYVSYEYERCCSIEVDEVGKLHRRLVSKRTVFDGDGGQGNQTFKDLDYSDYDGLGHYRTETAGGNLVNTSSRRTTTSYGGVIPAVNERWILDTYTERVVREAGVSAKTEYCFNPSTGFLERERILKSGETRGPNDVVAKYTPDADGNVRVEEYFGGDNQSLAVGALCGLSLPGPEYRMDHSYSYGSLATSRYFDPVENAYVSFYTEDNTIDRNTGLESFSRDTSGAETAYEYDKMGRLKLTQPSQDARTAYFYNEATPTSRAWLHIQRINPVGGGVMAESKITFDDFGRVFREEERIPGSRWSAKENVYNALGWKLSESEPGATGKTTRYLAYDPFGRAATVRPPEGSAHDIVYERKGERAVVKTYMVGTALSGGTVIDSPVQTVERYDNQGRLVHLVEDFTLGGPTSIGYGVAQPVTTLYSYDIGNRLSRVETNATVNGTPVQQVRTFTYDNRGFLTSESHPEKGSSSANGVISYSQHDSMGNLGQKNDVGHVTKYAYDKAARLRSIKDSGNRPLKEFDYAEANLNSDKRNGKLLKAVRHNYVDPPNDPGTAEVDVSVTETYSYTGLEGRVSRRDTTLSTGYSFTQGFSYTRLGLISSLTYPTCLHGTCADEAQPADVRAVTYGYTVGYLTSVTDSVTGAVSTIGYDWSRMVNQVNHANGVTDTIEVDPNSKRARPHRIYTAGALNAMGTAAQEWDTGYYRYDGAGNITATGSDYYLYDRRSRLIEATALSAGNRGQSYEYDLFGNMTRKITRVNGVQSAENFTTNAAKNRVTSSAYGSVAYGPRGNVTGHAGTTFTYDLFDQVQYQYNPNKIFIYTADDERIWTYDYSGPVLRETFSLRDLDGKLLREYLNQGGNVEGTWRVERDYIYRDSTLLSSWNSAEGLRQFHLDHLGTPRLITGQNRRRVAFHAYYPFGQEATPQAQDAEKLKFTGHERDSNFAGEFDDLDYMHARFYSPVVGRFFSVDRAASWEQGMPQSWNRYAYCLNNPLKYTDPDGEVPNILIGAGIGAGISGGAELISQLKNNGGDFKKVNWKKVGAATAGGAVAGAIAGATMGASLVVEVAVGGAVGAAAGAAVERAVDGDKETKALDGKQAVKDAAVGAVLSVAGAGLGKGASNALKKGEGSVKGLERLARRGNVKAAEALPDARMALKTGRKIGGRASDAPGTSYELATRSASGAINNRQKDKRNSSH